jgi:hypothetical protein
MSPVATGEQIAKPLVRQLMRDDVVGRPVEAGALSGIRR